MRAKAALLGSFCRPRPVGAATRDKGILRAMRRAACGVLVFLTVTAIPGWAQEMEPKAYSASPVGANFLVTAYSFQTGNVIFDPTLPVTDVSADVQGLAIGAGHSFKLFGDLGLVTFAVPIAWADVTGKVFEEATEVTRSGLADFRLKLSVNLVGNPAMSPREFARAPRHTVVGASVAVVAPTGQYYGSKLINLGANRWAFKPEVGVSFPKGRWDIDGYVGAWFFASNSDFFPGGAMRTQDPLLAVQAHASYTIRPRMWLAADGTWYHGGSARTNNGDPSVPVSNSRVGLTASLPIGVRYSVKVAFSRGAVVRTGTDFTTITVGWQALWLSSRWAGR